MGKPVKVLLALTLLISIGCFTLGIIAAQQAGMTIADLATLVRSNLEELNISPVAQEYNEVQETMSLEGHTKKTRIVIRNSFPDVRVTSGDEFKVELRGDVSSKLSNLLSWSADLDTVYINIASVFNDNPSSKGLEALVTLPQDGLDELVITSVSGDVSLLELPLVDQVRIEVKSGNVLVDSSKLLALTAVSQSGSLILDLAQTATDLKTASGDVMVTARSLAGSMKSTSGHIQVEAGALGAELALTNEAGSIDIRYESPDLRYDLSTQTGWLTIDGEEQKRTVKGTRGDGGVLLKAGTQSGSVTLSFDRPTGR